jgi:hypothetical protein
MSAGRLALAVVIAAAATGATRARAIAEPLPSGSLGLTVGAMTGTGASGAAQGQGLQYGLSAAWQPMTTQRQVGWSLRWSTVFGYLFNADAAKVSGRLRTVQMDLGTGVRIRPTKTAGSYLTLRAGVSLLRANEALPPAQTRDYVGPFLSAGAEQYVFGALLVSLDLRYGMLTSGPTSLALFLTVGTGS